MRRCTLSADSATNERAQAAVRAARRDSATRLIQGASRNEANRLDDAAFGGAVPLEKMGRNAAGLMMQ